MHAKSGVESSTIIGAVTAHIFEKVWRLKSTQWNRVFKVSLNKQGTSYTAYRFHTPLLQHATCHFLQQLNVVTIYMITNTLRLSIYTSMNTLIVLKLLVRSKAF
jgi:hypothetical protein